MSSTTQSRQSYNVGLICALATEKAALVAALDEKHPKLHNTVGDENDYSFGKIGVHNVVIVRLSAGVIGKAAAATVAKDMRRSFPIKIGLLVGICGGVWSKGRDVRLGDVIVSQPDGQHGGVVQWDFGKMERDGVFRRTGTLDKPPRVLLSALGSLQAKHLLEGDELQKHLEGMFTRYPLMANNFGHPGRESDILFETSYNHVQGDTCDLCDLTRLVQRHPHRADDRPRIHYGNIASGDGVMKDAQTRDRIAREEGILCFDMEAAGLIETFPCVVVRGVCDYADSHKNKRWQPYAAAMAASYAKELLGAVDPQGLEELELPNSTRYCIPFSLKGIPLADHFVPRDDEIRQIESFFWPTPRSTRRSMFVVYGMGGIGKTQLCVDFARRHKDDFSAVLWLDGSSEDAIRQSLATASLRLPKRDGSPPGQIQPSNVDVQEGIDNLLQWLSQPENTNWLLIFDNVDRDWYAKPRDPQAYDIDSVLPQVDHGNILVTTRLSRMRRPQASLDLRPANDDIAREMVEAQAGRRLDGIEPLLEKLNGLPLALVQAGAYLGDTGMSVLEYLKFYDKTWLELIELQEQTPRKDYGDRSILTTWKISYERVKVVNPGAAALLDLWAFFHPGEIWHAMIACSRHITTYNKPIPKWLLDLARNELSFRHAVGILSQYSLVSREIDSDSHSIHPVVHAWSFFNIQTEKGKRELCLLALRILSGMITLCFKHGQLGLLQRLVPHAGTAGRRFPDAPSTDAPDDLLSCAIILRTWGRSADGIEMYMRALVGHEEIYGPDHEITIDTTSEIASLYADLGKLSQAEKMLVRILKGQEEAWSPDHPKTLETVVKLSILYLQQGRLQEAEKLALRALKGFEKVKGPDHLSTINMAIILGIIYAHLGKMQEAEGLYKRALNGKEKLFVLNHLSPHSMYNLADLYFILGRMEDAERMYVRALNGFKTVFGPNVKDTTKANLKLSQIYFHSGRTREAEQKLFEAFEGTKKWPSLFRESILWRPDPAETEVT